MQFQKPTLPKGGGSITSGVTTKADTFTGAATFALSFPLTAGRADHAPSVALTYHSGQGNSEFGMGFSASIPKITMNTEFGTPKYDGNDLYLLGGQGELVTTGTLRTEGKHRVITYLPRIQEHYALIEQWINTDDDTSYWQVIGEDNSINTYGKNPEARIAHSNNPNQIFEWLIDQSTDSKGNKISYHYKAENLDNIPAFAYEKNRNRQTQRYISHICYGNYLDDNREKYAFEVVFNYGEYALARLDKKDSNPYQPVHKWAYRPDAFSHYNAGFEVRTLRLCQSILLFHHFDKELGSKPCLVHELAFAYQHQQTYQATELTTPALMQRATQTGYKRNPNGSYEQRSVPATKFSFSTFASPVQAAFQPLQIENSHLPGPWQGGQFLPIDLHHEGIAGILYTSEDTAMYYSPLGNGQYAAPEVLNEFPLPRDLSNTQATIQDLEGNGEWQIVLDNEGFYAQENGHWSSFKPFESRFTQIDNTWAETADMNANGKADAVLVGHDNIQIANALGKKGYGNLSNIDNTQQVPFRAIGNPAQVVGFGSVPGDGLQHRYRLTNGYFEYWPNLGRGRFSEKLVLANAPHFDEGLDARRVLTADVDGSGTMDLLYIQTDKVLLFFNQNGNSFSDPIAIPLPEPYAATDQVNVADILGNGTSCLVFTKMDVQPRHYYYNFAGDYPAKGGASVHSLKPYLLNQVNNPMGAMTTIKYNSSTCYYLQDKAAGRDWVTKIHFPVQVADTIIQQDLITGSTLVTRHAYHDGYYDTHPTERRFRGFGFVESWDTETVAPPTKERAYVPPVYTKTWLNTGVFEDYKKVQQQYRQAFYQGDTQAYQFPDNVFALAGAEKDRETMRQAYVALKGTSIRSEVYGLDDSAAALHPYTVEQSNVEVALNQPIGKNLYAVFAVNPRQSIHYSYDRNPDDPMVAQNFTLAIDPLNGKPTQSCGIHLPRRNPGHMPNILPEQLSTKTTASQTTYINSPNIDNGYWRGVVCERKTFEITGLELAGNDSCFSFDTVQNQVKEALKNEIAYSAVPAQIISARLLSWEKNLYWDESNFEQALPLGQIGQVGLHHHQTHAVFDRAFVKDHLGKITDDILEKEGGYSLDKNAGYYWARGVTAHYGRAKGQFYQLIKTNNDFVAANDPLAHKTEIAYHAPYYFSPASVKSYYSQEGYHEESFTIDYRLYQPCQHVDLNGNVNQVLFDPLGEVIATTRFGTLKENSASKPTGGMRLLPYDGKPAEYQPRLKTEKGEKITRQDVLANPEYYLQGARSFFFYDLNAWNQPKPQPVSAVSLLRNDNYHQQNAAFACQATVGYHDGFGRNAEVRQKVRKPKTANSPEGSQWQVSGKTVYNNKAQPFEQYLPFFSDTPAYNESTDESPIPPSRVHYDALGRIVRTDTPKGFFSQTVYGVWQTLHYDENDTVLQSPYCQEFVKNYPAQPSLEQQDEKDALEKAATMYNTPTLSMVDNKGAVVWQIEDNHTYPVSDLAKVTEQASKTNFTDLVTQHLSKDYQADEAYLITYHQTDILGRLQLSIDPRLYDSNVSKGSTYYNFRYAYDMVNESAVVTDSADAGTDVHVSNVLGNLFWSWSPRDYNQRIAYDQLQRKTTLYMRKIAEDDSLPALADYNQVEVFVYGESQPEAKQHNVRGKAIEIKDLSGVIRHTQFSLDGHPMRASRQMLQDYKGPANWQSDTAPVLETDIYYTAYSYDALGKVLSETTPDGSTTTNRYDEAGLLQAVAVTFTQPTQKTQAVITDIVYDQHNQRQAVWYGNGAKTTYTYEATTLRMVGLKSTRKTEAGKHDTLQNIGYTYDPVGNITRSRDASIVVVYYNQQKIEPLLDYAYDPLYRLVRASGRQQAGVPTHANHQDFVPLVFGKTPNDSQKLENYTQAFSYDAAGNLIKIQHVAKTTRWTKALGQDASATSLEVATNTNRLRNETYDASGNQTRLGTIDLTFNCCENLVKARMIARGEGKDDDAEYYLYDQHEQRTRKTLQQLTNGHGLDIETKTYWGHYERKTRRAGATTSLDRHTLRLMDGDQCVLISHYWQKGSKRATDTRQNRWQLSNHLGSVTMEVDDTAQLISYEEYYAYGGTALSAGKSQAEVKLKEYRYSGKERDNSTGLYYYGARYYLPWAGRWLKPDPAGTIDGLNLYAFVGGNPVNFNDPNGMTKRRRGRGKGSEEQREAKKTKPSRTFEEMLGQDNIIVPPSPVTLETVQVSDQPWETLFNQVKDKIGIVFRHQYKTVRSTYRFFETVHKQGAFSTKTINKQLHKFNLSTSPVDQTNRSFPILLQRLGPQPQGAKNVMRVIKGSHLKRVISGTMERRGAAVELGVEIGISEYARGGKGAVLDAAINLYRMKHGLLSNDEFAKPDLGYTGAGKGGAKRLRKMSNVVEVFKLYDDLLLEHFKKKPNKKGKKPWESGLSSNETTMKNKFDAWKTHKLKKWTARVNV